MHIIVLVVIVILAGLALFFLLRSRARADVDAAIDERSEEYERQGIDEDEARAKAAYEEALEALRRAQDAERQAMVEEQAERVRALEERLRQLQTAAILQPLDPIIIRDTEEAEAQAIIERRELMRRWTLALTSAETELVKADEAATVATTAYQSAVRKVKYWEADIKRLEEELTTIRIVSPIYEPAPDIPRTPEEALAIATRFHTVTTQLETSKRSLEVARHTEMRTKTDAYNAISSANLCVERVLTIIADVRLLGILLTLANRVDGVAIATRTKLAVLEARLEERA